MEVRSGYKHTDVGVIPDDWRVERLPEVCKFRGGKAHEQHISDLGKYVCVNSKFISSDGAVRKYSTANFCPAKKGDVLMVMSDLPNGRALAKAYLVGAGDTYAVNQRVCALSAYRDSPEYLFFVLNRNPYFLKFDDGVNQTHLLNPVFENCPLALPPTVEEQRAIATALSDVDALLGGLDRLITKKRDLKRAAMQQLLTGQTRLPGFCEEWTSTQLGSLLDRLANGAVYRPSTRDGVLITRIETIADGVVDYARTGLAVWDQTLEQYALHQGDILFSHINSLNHIGKAAIVTVDDRRLYHGMNLLLMRAAPTHNAKYLYYWLSSEPSRRRMRVLAKQAVSQASINTSELRTVVLSIPCRDEQDAVAAVLSDMDAELAALGARREKTRNLKQAMMQELFTGKTRLVPAGAARA